MRGKESQIKKSHCSGCLAVAHSPVCVAITHGWQGRVTGCLVGTREVTGTAGNCVRMRADREKKS